MIITPEAINWFLTGSSEIGYKSIIKLAKIKGSDIPDSLRKNLSNNFAGKNQSKTTISSIKLFLTDLTNNELLKESINDIDSSERIDISTPALRLEYIKSRYIIFFKSAKMEHSFLFHELKTTFNGLNAVISLKENGALESDIELKLNQDGLFPRIDLKDSLFLRVEDKVPSFNFDLLLYFFACLDAEEGIKGKTPFQLFLEYLLDDLNSESIAIIKSPFEYYILVIKYFHRNEDKKITDEEIAEILEMTRRDFYHYKSGGRAIRSKTIALFIEQGHILYFMALFWTKLIIPFSKDINSRQEIINKINLYPKLLDIAKVEFCIFERHKNRA